MANVNVRGLPLGRVLGKRALLYIALLVFAFALVLLLNTSNASATIVINTDITTDTTLTTADDYIISGDITVVSGVRLSIEPGVYVNFTSGSSLTIEGYLYVNGTQGSPVRMSGVTPTPGFWDGILLKGPSGSRMTYFEMSYAQDGIVIEDTTVSPFSGTINNNAGDAVTFVRTTGNLNVALQGFVLNGIGGDGYKFIADNGNAVVSLTNCGAFNVEGVGVYVFSPWGNASLSIVGGVFTSPTAGMFGGAWSVAYWNSSVSISGGASFYYAQIGAVAECVVGNAVVSMNGVTLGNVEGAGTSYGAAAIAYGIGGKSTIQLTNMVIRNATYGAFGYAPEGGVNIAVSGVTFDNITEYGLVAWAWEEGAIVSVTNCIFENVDVPISVQSNHTATINIVGTDISNPYQAVDVLNAFGGVNVVMTRVNITGIVDNGVLIRSFEAGANIVLTDVSVTGAFGTSSVYCDVNTTATITATRYYASGLFYGLGVETNGNVVFDVSDAIIENVFYAFYVFAEGGVNARIDPTLINHSQYGVSITSEGDVTLTLLDVDMNDTVYCVVINSMVGDIDFSWKNGRVTGEETTLVGVYLWTLEGAVTANMENVQMQFDTTDYLYWWNLGSADNSMLYISANQTVTITLTNVWSNFSWAGVFASSANGDMSFTASDVSIYNVITGVYLSAPGTLNIDVSDFKVLNNVFWGPVLGILDFTNNVNYVRAFDGRAGGDIAATFEGVETNMHGGIYLISDEGSIDLIGSDIVRYMEIEYYPGIWWFSTDMLWLEAPNGAVTAELSDVSFALYEGWPGYNGYGVNIVANESVSLVANGLTISGANNGIQIVSLIGDVIMEMTETSVMETTNNGMLIYAYDGSVQATFQDVLVDHSYLGNGLVIQAMGDLTITMVGVNVNDSAVNGVLMLSVMGNIMLDITDLEIANSGEDGLNAVAANGLIDVAIDPSVISSSDDVGMYLEAAGAVTVIAVDTAFIDNNIGLEIHSQEGGISVSLSRVEFSGNEFIGLFAEADRDDVVVECSESILTENYYGFYLNTLAGDVYISVNNASFELGGYGIWALSSNDIFATIVDSQFLGQSYGSVTLWADHDVVVSYLRDVFDGSSADNAQFFLPSESEARYVMIDPDVWTTNSWLTVDLDWPFEFNGVYYTRVTMSRYGWIGFGVTNVNVTYPDFGWGVPNMIAAAQNPYWNNHEYPGIGYKKVEGAIIFHWYVWQTGYEPLKNVFQIWLFQNGDVEIRYAMMETKDVSHPSYAYGINFNGGGYWDIRDWTYGPFSHDVFFNEWKSIYFTMGRASYGYGSWVQALGNVTATVKDSSVSYFMTGGMLFECYDGILNVNISDNSFSYIGGMYEPWAALSLVDYNGTMDVELTDLNFYYIVGFAIIMWDAPINGGSSNMVITNSYFEQVGRCAAMVSDASGAEGSFELSVTKKVMDNVGVHAGPFYTMTWLDTPLASWNLSVSTMFENNNIEGNLDPWLMMASTIAPPLWSIDPAQLYSYVELSTSTEENTIASFEVRAVNNTLKDGAIYGHGAIGTQVQIRSVGAGGITSSLNVLAQDNEIRDYYVPFSYGIASMINQRKTGQDTSASVGLQVNAEYLNNEVVFGYGTAGYGLMVQVYQPIEEGIVSGTCDVVANVKDNRVWYVGNGVSLYSETSLVNSWGSTSSNVVFNVQENDIRAFSVGVQAQAKSSASFSHYFPPYEQEVSATSDLSFAMDISGNEIKCGGNGIIAYADNFALEDYYGVFTSASATLEGRFDVHDNVLDTGYSNSYGYAMDLEASIQSGWGQSESSLNVDYSVTDNVVYANGNYGIYVSSSIQAVTSYLRIRDMPKATATTNVEILRNEVWYAYDAIMVEQDASAYYGQSEASLTAVVLIEDNIVEQASDEGIYVFIYGYGSSEEYGSPWVSLYADVSVVRNIVSGDSWEGECYAIDVEYWISGVYYLGSSYGTALIAENEISDAYIGILFYSEGWNPVPVTIIDNMVDS
ncbi:MAG: hypothetical protein QW520_05535, partial [Methanomassiliicoccales archaeon]